MRFTKSLQIALVSLGLVVPGVYAQSSNRTFRVPAPTNEQVSFLGVGLQEITSDRAKQLKLPEEAGVEVTRVDANSPASTAGIKEGDVILQYNGQRIEGAEQLTRMVRETPAGRDVKLQIFRNGATQNLTAKIGSHPAPFAPLQQGQLVFPTEPPQIQRQGPEVPGLPRIAPARPATGGGLLGIEAEPLSDQLAGYFGVKEGVLVRSVAKGSAAEKAGLKAGDVITRVGDTKVANPADVTRALGRNQQVSIAITRDHREMTLNASPAAQPGVERF